MLKTFSYLTKNTSDNARTLRCVLNNPYVCKSPEPLQRSSIQPLYSLKVSIMASYSSHDFITFLQTPFILKENRSPLLILVGKAPRVVQITKGVTVFVTPLLSVEKISCIFLILFLAWETWGRGQAKGKADSWGLPFFATSSVPFSR